MEGTRSNTPNKTICEAQDEESDEETLPKGIVPLDQYISEFHDFLSVSGDNISKSFYCSIPPKKFKLTCFVKVKQSLLAFPVYECFLKFDGRFVMAAQKGILGKMIISSNPKPEEDNNMLAKLSSSLKNGSYKLYEKVEGNS